MYKNSNVSMKIKTPIVYVIFVLICFNPYVFNIVFHLGNELFLLMFFFIITFLGIVRKKNNLPPILRFCFIIQICSWIIYSVLHTDTTYFSRVFFIVMTALLLLFLINRNSLFCFAKTYNYFIGIQAVLGVPIFFLLAFGLIQPLAEFQNIDGRPFYYLGLTFSNSITAGICRIAGFFDEPGALAFWGVYALIINKVTCDSHSFEYLLIVSLLFTLSAAYFIQLFLYILFFYSNKAKIIFPLILFLAIVTFITFSYLGDNERLLALTFERYEGGFSNTSRAQLTADAKKIFYESPIVGIGANKLNERGYYEDNPYEIPAKDGIMGCIITYLPLIIIMIKFGIRNKKVFLASLLLLIGYLQRPFHVNLLHPMMMYLFVSLVYYKTKCYEV